MNTSMDILGVKYEFGPSVFYLFGPLVKNLVLRFSIYSVLRIRSTVPARSIQCDYCLKHFRHLDLDLWIWRQTRAGSECRNQSAEIIFSLLNRNITMKVSFWGLFRTCFGN